MSESEKITQDVEFHDISEKYEWVTEGVKPPGGSEAIVFHDENNGSHCRFLRLPPGFKGGKEPLEHDCDEIVFIISGDMINTRLGHRYSPGTVAVFPKGTKHGPLAAPDGAVTLEFRYYKKD
jgi:mannose-6-phosphate isomerase-like protein (cupin superfamily)